MAENETTAEPSNVELWEQVEQELAASGDTSDDSPFDDAPAAPTRKARKARKANEAIDSETESEPEAENSSESEAASEAADADDDPDEDEDEDELEQAREVAKKRGLELVDRQQYERRLNLKIREERRRVRATLEQQHGERMRELDSRAKLVEGFEIARRVYEEDGDIDAALTAAIGKDLQALNREAAEHLRGLDPKARRERDRIKQEREQLDAERRSREESERTQQRQQQRDGYVRAVADELSKSQDSVARSLADAGLASLVVEQQERYAEPDERGQLQTIPLDEAVELAIGPLREYHALLTQVFGSTGATKPDAAEPQGSAASPPEGSSSARPARHRRARTVRQTDAAEASAIRDHLSDEEWQRLAISEMRLASDSDL